MKKEEEKNLSILPMAKEFMMRYGETTIENRALPDYRDGCKPVHRRLLYSAYTMNNNYNSPFIKSARLVGQCVGVFHPQGDSGVYGALGTLVNLPEQLFEGHGNWGSPDGDAPAAPRYTECRLSKYSNNYLLNRDYMAIVPTVDNFDGTTTEPVYLPSKLPGVLLSGAEGIAMGCTTLIPTFSRESVINLVKQSLKNKKGCTPEMCLNTLEFKFSYGGINNNDDNTLLEYYKTGEGKLNFIPEVEITKKGHIIVTTLTPRLKPSQIYDTILEKEKSAVRDCKNIHGKGCSYWAEIIPKGKLSPKELKQLAKKIQNDYSTNLSCKTLVTERQDDGENVKFMRTNIPQIVNMWIDWRLSLEKKVVERLIRLEEEKKQRLLWLIWAIDHLEIIFKALKSKDPDFFLIKKGKITEEHAKYILDGVVRRLSKLSKSETQGKIKICEKIIKEYKNSIATRKDIAKRIYKDLNKF